MSIFETGLGEGGVLESGGVLSGTFGGIGGRSTLPSEYQQFGARDYPSRRLAARAAPTTTTNLYEVPPNKSARVDRIFICGVGGGNATVRIHHLRPGETASVNNALYYDLSITAKTTSVVDSRLAMTAGDRIAVSANNTDHVCITLYGDET